jgi:AcrR family transcriptional regulator
MAIGKPDNETHRSEGWAKRHERVARHIERVALELIASEGSANATVEHIAARAGISNRTYFRYFSTRDDVMSALPLRLVQDFCTRVAARPASESVMEAFVAAALSAQDEPMDEGLMLLWGQARRHWPVEAPREPIIAVYQKVIAKRIGAPVEELRVQVMATAIGGVIWVAFLRWLASDGAEPLNAIVEESVIALAELSEHFGQETSSPNKAFAASPRRNTER